MNHQFFHHVFNLSYKEYLHSTAPGNLSSTDLLEDHSSEVA